MVKIVWGTTILYPEEPDPQDPLDQYIPQAGRSMSAGGGELAIKRGSVRYSFEKPRMECEYCSRKNDG